jgi:selenocysteine lyase/cysteine desulfurase
MRVTRKQLLAGGAALALAGCGAKKPPATAAEYALDPSFRHFDAFLFAAHPKPVRDAIERHRRGLDAGAAAYLHEHEQEFDAAVAAAASRYLGVRSDELAFTDSTTMGLGLVYGGMLGPGDEVLTTEHDHYATHEALRLSGATVRKVRLYDDPAAATVEGMVGALAGAITPRTKLLALTWVHSGTGVKVPVERLGELAGPRVVLDAVHALGVEDQPLERICDVFVAGTHKWLGGPRGTGIVWSSSWDQIRPTIPSFAASDAPGPRFTPGGWHSFEHRWALAEAFAYQSRLGRSAVADHVHTLAQRLKDGLAALPNVRLITPRDPAVSSGIVCFEVDGMDASTAVSRLLERRIRASVTPYAERYVRLGTSLHVDAADVDAAVGSVKALQG